MFVEGVGHMVSWTLGPYSYPSVDVSFKSLCFCPFWWFWPVPCPNQRLWALTWQVDLGIDRLIVLDRFPDLISFFCFEKYVFYIFLGGRRPGRSPINYIYTLSYALFSKGWDGSLLMERRSQTSIFLYGSVWRYVCVDMLVDSIGSQTYRFRFLL